MSPDKNLAKFLSKEITCYFKEIYTQIHKFLLETGIARNPEKKKKWGRRGGITVAELDDGAGGFRFPRENRAEAGSKAENRMQRWRLLPIYDRSRGRSNGVRGSVGRLISRPLFSRRVRDKSNNRCISADSAKIQSLSSSHSGKQYLDVLSLYIYMESSCLRLLLTRKIRTVIGQIGQWWIRST